MIPLTFKFLTHIEEVYSREKVDAGNNFRVGLNVRRHANKQEDYQSKLIEVAEDEKLDVVRDLTTVLAISEVLWVHRKI